jgi:hypothetical protein
MVELGFGWRRAHARSVFSLACGLAVAFVVVMSGCATMGGLTKDAAPEAKSAAVTERVKARWAAMIDGNLDLAYTFLSPASKEIVPLAAYKQQARGSGYRAIKVESVECDGAVCKVRVVLTYDHRLMKGMMTPLDEKWVIEEGKAWYVWGQ